MRQTTKEITKTAVNGNWLRLYCGLIFLLGLNISSTTAREITIASSVDDYDLSNYLEEFKQRTNIDVNFAALDSSNLKMELIIRADNGTLPDAIIVPGDFLGLETVNYSKVPRNWLTETQPQSSVQHGTVNGRLLGIPILSGNHLVLFYNKAFISEPARNWEILRNQKQQLPDGIELIRWSYNEMFWFIPFLGAFDAYPYSNGNISLNTEGTIKALEFYRLLAEDNVVSTKCHYQCSFDLFVSGKLAYTINGSWALGRFQQSLGNNLGIALLPNIGDRSLNPYSSVFALAFPNQSISKDKSESLQQLALFLQSTEIQQRIWKELRALPSHRDVFQQIVENNNEDIANYVQQLTRSEPMPNVPEMAIIWEALLRGFNRYQGDALKADEAVKYMQYVAEKSQRELY